MLSFLLLSYELLKSLYKYPNNSTHFLVFRMRLETEAHVMDPITWHVKDPRQSVGRVVGYITRLYWTSHFFSPGKHLMANELCAILVKYITFEIKKQKTFLVK